VSIPEYEKQLETSRGMPTLNDLVEKIKREMDPLKVGMIACHNGTAGDIRENVLPVLENTLNRLKKEAVKKREKPLGL
jgi:hypothetical protein